MEYTTLEQVKIRLKQFHIDTVTNDDDTTSDVVVFDKKEDNPLIEQLIKQATEDVKAKRCYPDTFTDDDITADLKQFENVVINLAVYDHSQAGENYMSALSEGGKTEINCLSEFSLLSKCYSKRRLSVIILLMSVKW